MNTGFPKTKLADERVAQINYGQAHKGKQLEHSLYLSNDSYVRWYKIIRTDESMQTIVTLITIQHS